MMSRENQLGVLSTIAALLVLIFSVVNSRRGESSIIQIYEFASLPFGVILLLLLAVVVFFAIVPTAEILDRSTLFGLGLSVLGLLLVLFAVWLRSPLSLDWGFLSAVSIVVSAGGVLLGETGRKQSARLGLSHLAIALGTLVIVVNFVGFALDLLVI